MVKNHPAFVLLAGFVILLLMQNQMVTASFEYNVDEGGEYTWNFDYREYNAGVSMINFTGTIDVVITSATNASVKGTIDPSPAGTLNTTIGNKYVQLFRSDENHDSSVERDLSVVYYQLIKLPDYLPVDFKASFVFPVGDDYWDNLPSSMSNLGTSDGTYSIEEFRNGGVDYYNVTGQRNELPSDGCKCSFEYVVEKDTGIIYSYTRSSVVGLPPISFDIEMKLQESNSPGELPSITFVMVSLPILMMVVLSRKTKIH